MQSNPRIPYRLPSERPKLAPPDGKPLIVHVVVNIEHWQFDQPIPRLVMTPPQGRGRVPDVPNFSWGEYGNRCGMPRLIKLLSERGLPVTATLSDAKEGMWGNSLAPGVAIILGRAHA